MKATFTLAPGVARREVLGADDVTDAELEAMVAERSDDVLQRRGLVAA